MDKKIKSLLVFCGSKDGREGIYAEAARKLGKYMISNDIRLVYGGSRTGLMGVLAREILDNEGSVIGVMPGFMTDQEVILPGLSELIIVETLQERKAQMEKLSDACITLPGGFGTMDELFEMLTWSQLGLHDKPVGMWNVNGYYNHLLKLLDLMVENGFLRPGTRDLLIVSDDLRDLVSKMEAVYTS